MKVFASPDSSGTLWKKGDLDYEYAPEKITPDEYARRVAIERRHDPSIRVAFSEVPSDYGMDSGRVLDVASG